MQKIFFILPLGLLFVFGPSQAEDQATDTYRNEAQAAIQAVHASLKQALGEAIQAGGPPQAISVCHDIAPDLMRDIAAARGLLISRTSSRVRNPDHVPDAWEEAVLARFASRAAAGEPIAEIDEGAIVEQDNGRFYRYMKAIPTQEVCLTCHGSELAPEVTAKLDEFYPEDQARGYRQGELRGAFTVTIPMQD